MTRSGATGMPFSRAICWASFSNCSVSGLLASSIRLWVSFSSRPFLLVMLFVVLLLVVLFVVLLLVVLFVVLLLVVLLLVVLLLVVLLFVVLVVLLLFVVLIVPLLVP